MVLGKTFLKKVGTALHVLFLKKTYQESSELSIYVLELKQKVLLLYYPWNIALKSNKYISGSQKCALRICEKLLIARRNPNWINVTGLFQYAGMEVNLLWIAPILNINYRTL